MSLSRKYKSASNKSKNTKRTPVPPPEESSSSESESDFETCSDEDDDEDEGETLGSQDTYSEEEQEEEEEEEDEPKKSKTNKSKSKQILKDAIAKFFKESLHPTITKKKSSPSSTKKKPLQILFTIGRESKQKYKKQEIEEEEEEEEEDDSDYEGSESDSESESEDKHKQIEKEFMKEIYKEIDEIDNTVVEVEQNKKLRSDSTFTESMVPDDPNIEAEYLLLLELKKNIVDKLKKTPKNKLLLKEYTKYNTQIRELIKTSQKKNAREYIDLVNQDYGQCELKYFKHKLSNKEQRQIIEDLEKINKCIYDEKPIRIALLQSVMPIQSKAIAMEKVNKLEEMETHEGEFHKLQYWVNNFMRIPFGVYRNLDITLERNGPDECRAFMERSKRVLDECIYGMEGAKTQILQVVGQWITNPNSMGTAIAIKGPMGIGKTNLIRNGISKILNREFAFIALGGAKDSSYLDGHGYTYEGSSWGKIVDILIQSKCMNPVIYFDELDKVSDSNVGQEIIGILTHLTDSTQNSEFRDKYFSETTFDLSRCLFIFSYNDESKVNPILRDRMYVIQANGYDVKDKNEIVKGFLLPNAMREFGFTKDNIVIPEETVRHIVGTYTDKEEGVRNLKRCIETILSKINMYRLMMTTGSTCPFSLEFPILVGISEAEHLLKNGTNSRINESHLAMYN